MNNCVDDLIMYASEESAVRAFNLVNPGLTLEASGWDGVRVTFRDIVDNSHPRVFLSFLPQNYRGEQDGFTLTERERQLAYEELSMYGVQIENLVIDSAEMFQWPFEAEKEQVSKQAQSACKENVSRTASAEKSRAAAVRIQKNNIAAGKVSSWLASHSLEGADDTFAWSSKKDEMDR